MECLETIRPLGFVGQQWRNTLAQIPTLFGRLVFLASLRDPDSGRYAHYRLAHLAGPVEMDRVLRHCHVEVFEQWLLLSLAQQCADLVRYLAGAATDTSGVLEDWSRKQPCDGFVPPSAIEAERMLYSADIRALVAVLRNEWARETGIHRRGRRG